MNMLQLEQFAHSGLNSVDGRAQKAKIAFPWAMDPYFLNSLSTAQDISLTEGERGLVTGLYKDSRWLIRSYARSVVAHDARLLTSVDHVASLQRSSAEILRLACVGDDFRNAFMQEADQLEEIAGMPAFGFTDTSDTTLVAYWDGYFDYSLRSAPPARGCPALKLPSSVDPSKSMADCFFHRFVDVLGVRTIAHHTQTNIGQIAVLT